MKKNYFKSLLVLAAATLVVASCEKEDSIFDSTFEADTPQFTTTGEAFVVAVSSSGYDYLLYTDSLERNLTVRQYSVPTGLSSAQWYFLNNKMVYGLKYNDGDPVPVESYYMRSTVNTPSYYRDYTSYRFTTYGTWGDYMVTSAANNNQTADEIYNSDTEDYDLIKDPYYNEVTYPRYMYVGKYDMQGNFTGTDFLADNYLGTGEYCSMAGFAESNGWLYVSVYPMGITGYAASELTSSLEAASTSYYSSTTKYQDYISSAWGGSGSGSFTPGSAATTLFPDQFHVAIFKDWSDFPNNPIKITDPRMSPACGRQQSAQYPTIAADQEGDVYIFSPGNERSYAGAGVQLYNDSGKTESESYPNNMVDHRTVGGETIGDGLYYKAAGTHVSKVMRIAKGTTELDESYGCFDIENVIGGRSFISVHYIKGSTSKFLVKAMNESGVQYSTANNKFYVFDAATKTAVEVTGMPTPENVTATSRNPFFENGKAYIGITSSKLTWPSIFEIDSSTGAASKIAEVECSNILSIGKLVSE